MINKSLNLTLISAGLLLTACATTPDTSTSGGVNDGVASVSASGVGGETNFGGNKMQVGNQRYYYDFDKNEVRADDIPSIKVQANYLVSHSNGKVLLAGNTDERGSREYNIALGERRAMSVATILQANGVSKSQITTVSYGSEKPVALGHTDADYQQNRRTDLTYQSK